MSVTSKPKIFIGSSREASSIAKALQHELRDVAYSEVWSQGLFRLGAVGLDDLVRAANGFDFGVFVFAQDDVLRMRDMQHTAVRDNVLFELGMFIGKLGPRRSFFVVPEPAGDLHLPSDLQGITPAKYDAQNSNPQVAVAPACFEISRAIKVLGPLNGHRTLLYDSKEHGHPRMFRGLESFVHKGHERVGEKAKGSLVVGPEGLLTVRRTNNAGRFEIYFRPQGPKGSSFSRTVDPPPLRPLHVTCSAKAEGASHLLRFVAKDEENDKWLFQETRTIEPGDWRELDFYLWVDSTKDFLLRIDDEEVSEAPASLLIRDLRIVDETELQGSRVL
jgi:hypothetical protein